MRSPEPHNWTTTESAPRSRNKNHHQKLSPSSFLSKVSFAGCVLYTAEITQYVLFLYLCQFPHLCLGAASTQLGTAAAILTTIQLEHPLWIHHPGSILLLLGILVVFSWRRRGWQRKWWLDSITDSMHVSLSQLREMVKDRKGWCVAVHGVTKSWTWLSDSTMNNKLEAISNSTSLNIFFLFYGKHT